MKVFISWSGPRSGEVASALSRCIREVLPAAAPWTSSDLEVGTSWMDEIAHQLQGSKIGIICLSKDNKNAPWLLFEAGALSKTALNVYVYLVDLDFSQVATGPLGQFKMITADEKGTTDLIQSINRHLKPKSIPENRLRHKFAQSWPTLLRTLRGSIAKDWEDFELSKVAIVLADIAGSSRLSALAKDRSLQEFFARARRLQGKHKGRSIKYLGDSFLVIFQKSATAFAFARDLQRSLYRDPILSGDVPLQARVGVHTGMARLIRTSYGQDLIGEAINIVARLTPMATPGEIVVSGPAREAIPSDQRKLLRPKEQTILRGGGELVEFSRFTPIYSKKSSLE